MTEDSLLMTTVLVALQRDKHFDDVQIKVTAKESVIILEGRIYDVKQHRLAENIAKNTKDVTAVDNRLTLREPVFETLTELEMISSKNIPVISDMRHMLDLHPSINARAIKIVSAKRFGVFYLRGYVRTVQEREAVEKMFARVTGIRYLINEIVVDEDYLEMFSARMDSKLLKEIKEPEIGSLTEKYFINSSNRRLMTDINSALLMHPRLDATNIKVTPENTQVGIFHLSGTVPSEDHKKVAGEVARKVRGVKYVDNDLQVRPKE
jgi:osmotically-inducible protein OsmY